METPSSSSRTITRSQALAMAANNTLPISSSKTEEPEKGFLKSRERSVLIDITNDSPIVGLAIGNLKTPSSTLSKKRMVIHPGSGEALLRGQVKNLLQKVEEEAFFSKISFEPRSLIHKQGGFVNSPLFVHAPTPFNTPQVSENDNNESESLNVSSSVEESFSFLQMLDQQEESEESNLKTRSLFMDSSEDEDDASVWSVEVNASTSDEHEDDDEEFKENYEDGEVDEVCEVISKIRVNGNGKHTRFVYDINSELEEEEVEEFEPSSRQDLYEHIGKT